LLAHQIANELLADKGLSDVTYASAEASFSPEELVALVARIGSFSMTCCTANAFDITRPMTHPLALRHRKRLGAQLTAGTQSIDGSSIRSFRGGERFLVRKLPKKIVARCNRNAHSRPQGRNSFVIAGKEIALTND
jgi:hypothetical protein